MNQLKFLTQQEYDTILNLIANSIKNKQKINFENKNNFDFILFEKFYQEELHNGGIIKRPNFDYYISNELTAKLSKNLEKYNIQVINEEGANVYCSSRVMHDTAIYLIINNNNETYGLCITCTLNPFMFSETMDNELSNDN